MISICHWVSELCAKGPYVYDVLLGRGLGGGVHL